jgi:hypothetical protein
MFSCPTYDLHPCSLGIGVVDGGVVDVSGVCGELERSVRGLRGRDDVRRAGQLWRVAGVHLCFWGIVLVHVPAVRHTFL